MADIERQPNRLSLWPAILTALMAVVSLNMSVTALPPSGRIATGVTGDGVSKSLNPPHGRSDNGAHFLPIADGTVAGAHPMQPGLTAETSKVLSKAGFLHPRTS